MKKRFASKRTVQQKLQAAGSMYEFALSVKKNQLKQKSPDLNTRELTRLAAEKIHKGTR